jgi:hypothetical protein
VWVGLTRECSQCFFLVACIGVTEDKNLVVQQPFVVLGDQGRMYGSRAALLNELLENGSEL